MITEKWLKAHGFEFYNVSEDENEILYYNEYTNGTLWIIINNHCAFIKIQGVYIKLKTEEELLFIIKLFRRK